MNKEWNVKVDFITFYKFSVTDAMYFEIQYETYRMMQDILGILEYISKEHNIIFIISKLHLAPYSTLKLIKAIIDQTIDINAVLMYNDEFILMRQEDSDFYKSEMNCRQPVRAAKILTIQKSDDKI